MVKNALQIAAEKVFARRFLVPGNYSRRVIARIAIGKALREDLIENGIFDPIGSRAYSPLHRRYPLIPVVVIPAINWRCAIKNAISAGRVAVTVPAMSKAHWVPYFPWNIASPSCTVR